MLIVYISLIISCFGIDIHTCWIMSMTQVNKNNLIIKFVFVHKLLCNMMELAGRISCNVVKHN